MGAADVPHDDRPVLTPDCQARAARAPAAGERCIGRCGRPSVSPKDAGSVSTVVAEHVVRPATRPGTIVGMNRPVAQTP